MSSARGTPAAPSMVSARVLITASERPATAPSNDSATLSVIN